MTTPASKTRLRKIDTVDEDFAVVTYEASRDGKVLGTITKYDRPAHKTVMTWKSGRPEPRVRDYREVYWACDPDPYQEGYELRADCVKNLERIAGVES
ncbi:hypothetical protein [Streptomyces sp. MH60]|uniref:hypothetical protein n=1 Tax=Streptomyces sp. MH60 TaxID=1940758 RepID=UPI000CEDBFB6|nr:hypothetical protein [Streptomyces sp. MH60]PPS89563.1 hypothetical protein BZZ08_01710 [Streptomyces sp. MH60]